MTTTAGATATQVAVANLTAAQRLVRLTVVLDRLDAIRDEEKLLKEEREQLDESIRKDWIESLQTSATVNGRRLSVRRTIFASVTSDGPKDAAYAALLADDDWRHLVGSAVNHNSLSKQIRDLAEAEGVKNMPPEEIKDRVVPEAIRPYLYVGRRSQIVAPRVKKGR